MAMTRQKSSSGSQKRQVQLKTVGLYPVDLADVETIREHYRLENFAQAVRRAIRDTATKVAKEQETRDAAA